MLRSKSPLADNREIVMMLLHFAVTFCHVTMSFYEDKYCRLLGPFYINYKSRVHQSYHLLVIVLFIFLSERRSIALYSQSPVCQGGHYTSPSVGSNVSLSLSLSLSFFLFPVYMYLGLTPDCVHL